MTELNARWVLAHQARSARNRVRACVMLLFLMLTGLTVLVLLPARAHSAEREATCWLGGCSGVCVDPAGVVLSAKHCGFPVTAEIEFRANGTKVTGHRFYEGSYEDDVVAFRLPAGTYPAAVLAADAPRRGEVVYTFGYPAGHFESLSGTVVGEGAYTDGTPLIVTTIPARGGHSGGPLFNMRGEVVGLASTSEVARAPSRIERPAESNWIATPRLRKAVQAQGSEPSVPGPRITPLKPPRLIVFTATWCGPCRVFHADVANNIGGLRDYLEQQGFERTRGGKLYGSVEPNILGGWDKPEVARECQVRTGVRVQSFPTFWVEGSSQTLVGYGGPEKLKAYLVAQLAAAAPPPEDPRRVPELPGPIPTPAVPPGPPQEQTPFQRLEPEPDPKYAPPVPEAIAPAPAVDEDWADFKVIVLVARQNAGVGRGAALRAALELEGGAIRRKFQEATKGRADVELVSERLSPKRFASVTESAGLAVDQIHVLLLVRKQDLGELRGRAVELIEQAVIGLTERSAQVPLDLVSERLHPEIYAAVSASMNTSDESAPEVPLWSAPLAALVGLLKRRFLNKETATA